MTTQQFFKKILKFHESSYDISKPFCINNSIYDAYASFNVKNSKYLLSKKAEIWRADCFEHVFFYCTNNLQESDIKMFESNIKNWIEPNLIKEGCKYPDKNHMYTYLTLIIISTGETKKEILDTLKKFKYVKNYCFGIRGYCETRILLFDLTTEKIIGNRSAKNIIKEYRKINNLWK